MKTFKKFLIEDSKSTKEEAHYRDHPNGKEHCLKCTMFRQPHTCTAVQGIISQNGWCKFYEAKK